MIIRARVVVTMDGPPIENGAVVVSGDRIVVVGKFSEIKDLPQASFTSLPGRGRKASPARAVAAGDGNGGVVDLGEQVLLPGLINAHCHLDYTCLRGKIPPQKSFADWIRSINAAKAKLSAQDYVASIQTGFAEAKRFGTTTIANLTAFPELVSQIEPPIRTWWFAELIDVRNPDRANETADDAVKELMAQEHWGLAPHALFTASAKLYGRCGEIAERDDVLLTTHLAESREETSMFRDASGPLYEFLKEIGGDMADCGNATPVECFFDRTTSLRAIEGNRRYLLVHLNEISSGDFDLLKKSAPKSPIVHCPRSHEYFGHSPFQFQNLLDAGFNICLGTDSLASNNDLSLFAEMRAFQKKFSDVAPEKILEMATVNPARALRQETTLGKIRAGCVADLIALPMEKSKSIFEEIIAFDRQARWSMLGGQVLA